MYKQFFARLFLVGAAAISLVASAFSQQVFTSLSDGTKVPQDVFPAKSTVYLNGGTNLSNGIYYFQVTGTNGKDLLSTDPAVNRQVMVYNGSIYGIGTYYSSSNGPANGATSYLNQPLPVGTHEEGTYSSANGSVAIQLLPFATTTNNGGEYKMYLIPHINANGSVDPNTSIQSDGLHLNYKQSEVSTHNFKVLNSRIQPVSTLIVQKYSDLNANGVLDSGEPPLNGFKFHVLINGGGTPLTDFFVTSGDDGAGVADVTLNPGDRYSVMEVLSSAQLAQFWQQTQPSANGMYIGTFTLGPVTTLFGNFMGTGCVITANCPPSLTGANALQCYANVPAPATDYASFVAQGGTASDSCQSTVTVTWVSDQESNPGSSCANTITRTYVVNSNNNDATPVTCTQTIYVNNTTPPTVTAPSAVSVQCISNVPAPATDYNSFVLQGGTATANCATDTLTVTSSDSASNGTSNCGNTITRTYQVTDDCGNIGTCTQTITVNNTTAPSITAPGALSVQCFSNVPAPATDYNSFLGVGGTAAGNCSTDTVTISWVSDTATAATSNCNNIITRTYMATDDCGNTATATQTITVNNTTPPTVTGPTGVSVQCYSSVPAPVADYNSYVGIGGTVTGQCASDTFTVSSTDSPTNGTSNCNNTITRTYTVTDECGNFATATQTITVNNTTPPKITAPSAVSVQCLGNVPAPAGNYSAFLTAGGTATGNCSNDTITITWVGDSPSNGSSNCNNTITRTYKATDECGNNACATQTITVNNTTAPTINCPGPVTAQLSAGQCTASPSLGIPTGHDNCGGNVTFTNDAPSSFSPGVYTVTWTATDSCGNKASCTQSVTVYTSVSGTKYFGVPSGGGFTTPTVVPGYKIQLLSGNAVIATTYTNSSGNYFFGGLLPGSFSVREVNPNGNWENITAPSVGPFSLSCALCVNFENACDSPVTNGLGKGFWANKNGEAVLQAHDPAWRTLLNGINMRTASGSLFTISTTASFSSAFASFNSWIGSADAKNMANMLSAQLAANVLSCAYNGLNVNAYIVVPHSAAVALGLPTFPGGDGYVTIANLQSLSVATLGANGYTTGGSAAKAYQGVLEGILDSINSDQIGQISGAPCPFGSY